MVLYGFPKTEGNVVALIGELSRTYRGTIYWMDGVGGGLGSYNNVQIVRRYSFFGLWKYLTAETVFFTHGLYGDPVPSPRSTVVNLWHGDGIKVKPLASVGKRSMVPATYVVAGTELLGRRKAHDFRMSPDAVLFSGNPRIDLFKTPTDAHKLHQLGIDPERPFVFWMPTFRSTKAVGATAGWSDVDLSSKGAIDGGALALVEKLATRGIQLVVKPHPLDAESRDIPGAISVTDELIAGAGTNLYALLAASAGLVTDYSSVWTDYLTLDRPIGFLVPDRADYENGRGVYPTDILNTLPGPDVTLSAGIEDFIADLLEGSAAGRKMRCDTVRRLGLVQADNASLKLLTMLDDRNCFKHSGGLRLK